MPKWQRMTCHASCCEYGIGRQTMTPTIFKRALFQPHRACVLLSAAMLAGCGREDISVYSVPKEAPHSHAPSLPSGHPDIHSMALARPELKWERLPEGWEAEPAGGMRVASFKVTDPENRSADIAVIPLPAGGQRPGTGEPVARRSAIAAGWRGCRREGGVAGGNRRQFGSAL